MSAAAGAVVAARKGRPTPARRRAEALARAGAAVAGGLLFVWGVVTLAIALLVRSGVSYADARTFAYLVAFLVYVAAFCWAFAAASAMRAWIVLAGGGAAMTGLAWCLTRGLA